MRKEMDVASVSFFRHINTSFLWRRGTAAAVEVGLTKKIFRTYFPISPTRSTMKGNVTVIRNDIS